MTRRGFEGHYGRVRPFSSFARHGRRERAGRVSTTRATGAGLVHHLYNFPSIATGFAVRFVAPRAQRHAARLRGADGGLAATRAFVLCGWLFEGRSRSSLSRPENVRISVHVVQARFIVGDPVEEGGARS